MTAAERDDPAAEAAFRAKYPDQKPWIDSLLPVLKGTGSLILSLDVKGPGPANFPAELTVSKIAGPLTADIAKASAPSRC